MHNTNDRAQVVITKNVNQAKGIVNAACGVVLGWGDKDASIAAEAGGRRSGREGHNAEASGVRRRKTDHG